MVVCPKCGSTLQNRKLLLLTNQNAVTCKVCGSRLRVKNKRINSAIGGAGGSLGAATAILCIMLWLMTDSMAYLGLLATLIAAVLLVSGVLIIKYIKLELDAQTLPRSGQPVQAAMEYVR